MTTCPNCGTQNEDGARFCAECGADLRSLSSSQPANQRTQAFPPQYAPAPPNQETVGGWQTPSDVPPPPPTKGRKTWLWIVVGILAACLICCCAASVYFSTDSGRERLDNLGTRFADQLTETAPTPHR